MRAGILTDVIEVLKLEQSTNDFGEQFDLYVTSCTKIGRASCRERV